MLKQTLIIEPPGGLCNRLNVMRSSYFFAQKYEYNLVVLWNNNAELGCNFKDIFSCTDIKVISLKWPKASLRELVQRRSYIQLVYSIFFRAFYKLVHTLLLRKECTLNAREVGQNLSEYSLECEKKILSSGRVVYYRQHLWANTTFDYSMLPFKEKLIQAAEQLVDKSDGPVIGVHIRRTDHTSCMERTSIIDFEEKLNQESLKDCSVKFYVATDDEEELQNLKKLFPGKIICNETCQRNRNSREGIYSAIIDLLALSKTQKVIGSRGSTFSYVAAYMGQIPVEFYYSDRNEWEEFVIQ